MLSKNCKKIGSARNGLVKTFPASQTAALSPGAACEKNPGDDAMLPTLAAALKKQSGALVKSLRRNNQADASAGVRATGGGFPPANPLNEPVRQGPNLRQGTTMCRPASRAPLRE